MFQPNYKNLVHAVCNQKTDYVPLYEHNIDPIVMERLTGKKFAHLLQGNYEQKLEFFRYYSRFQKDMGYDAVTFECLAVDVMPGNGCLYGHNKGCIETQEDFDQYPWKELPDKFFAKNAETYKALRETMPEGMLAVGGVGNGVFECVQDIVGLENLCYLRMDEEEVYAALFVAVGDMLCEIWDRFLKEFGDVYCICRFGDDLGFSTSTLLPEEDIKKHLIPQYKRIVDIIHRHNKPFLMHSCGCIFPLMDELIDTVKIDAKHSNEEQIAPFKRWMNDYGTRIGNFGGLDTSYLCAISLVDIEEYTTQVYSDCVAKGYGVAIGSGNSIPDYVDEQKYKKAVDTIRKLRGC